MKKVKIALIFCCLALCAALLNPFAASGQQSNQKTAPVPAPTPQQPVDYNRFTHKTHQGRVKVPNTNFARELKCDSCHERPSQREIEGNIVATTDRNKQFSLKFPGHKACVECHIVQFASKPQQTCTICHDTKQGLNARPPQGDFPRRKDFNAFFDAKQHELHVGYTLPNNGQKLDCAFCHQQTAKPTFLTIASHPECYACHSPQSGDQKGSQKSGCVVCHQATTDKKDLDPFSKKYVSRAYGAQFTHKSHVAYVNGRCDACHTISGGYNQPTPTSIRIKQHLNPGERSGRGCFSCHDGGVHYGRTIFSGNVEGDGRSSCSKCHTRDDNKVFATS